MSCPVIITPEEMEQAACFSSLAGGSMLQGLALSYLDDIAGNTPVPPTPPDHPTDPALLTYDDFDDYVVTTELVGQYGGVNWPNVWLTSGDPYGYEAEESFESYTPGVNLSGLNGGTGSWGSAWDVQN
jgi:hypothetical protein